MLNIVKHIMLKNEYIWVFRDGKVVGKTKKYKFYTYENHPSKNTNNSIFHLV